MMPGTRLLRAAGAALALAAATTHAQGVNAQSIEKLGYCGAVCSAATVNCATTNSPEYCSVFFAGCMGSCIIF